MKTAKLYFCADDWGFSPGINEGILDLAQRGLLYSVSCTANSEYLSYKLKELLVYQDTGLSFNIHFNLTYKKPINLENKSFCNKKTGDFESFKIFLMKSCFNLISALEIKNEFEEQMRILLEHGIPITCLDGHQHIHLLPFVFKCIESSLNNVGIKKIRYMNDVEHPLSYLQGVLFKKMMLKNYENIQIVSCGYLLGKNLKNLDDKIKRHDRLIIHPAKFDDFLEKNMTDKLRSERVIEYNKIMEYFNER